MALIGETTWGVPTMHALPCDKAKYGTIVYNSYNNYSALVGESYCSNHHARVVVLLHMFIHII